MMRLATALALASCVSLIAGYGSGAGSTACGFGVSDGNPGGPGSSSHGTLVAGNGGYTVTFASISELTASFTLAGSAPFAGFLIQSNDGTLSSAASGARVGSCSHGSLTHTGMDAKSTIAFDLAMTSVATTASFKVTVLSQRPGDYWIFDVDVSLSASSTTAAADSTTTNASTTTIAPTTTTTVPPTTTRDPNRCYPDECAPGLECVEGAGCNVSPKIITKKEAGGMGSKLTLQAAKIIVSHWNNVSKQKETFDLLERIVSIETAMGSLSGDTADYVLDTLVYDNDTLAEVLETVESRLLTQRGNVSTQAAADYATFSDDVPLASKITTLEESLAEAATMAATATLNSSVASKAKKEDVYNLDQFDSLEESAESAHESFEVKLDDYATKAFVDAVEDTLQPKAAVSIVDNATTISSRFQALQSELDTKVVTAEYPSKEDYDAARAKVLAWTATSTLTSSNSGPCLQVLVGVDRLNLDTARVEICDQGTIGLFWRPVSAPADCTALDYHGTCVECHQGMALLLDGTCIKPAELLHLELDGEEVNLAPLAHARERPTFHSIPSSSAYVSDGPWGKPALNLAGSRYMNLPSMLYGGQLSLCYFVRHQGPKKYASLFAIGNVGSAYTSNPSYGDIIWMKFIDETRNAQISTMRGQRWKHLQVNDAWAFSEQHWAHYCVSYYMDGGRALFINGIEKGRAGADADATLGYFFRGLATVTRPVDTDDAYWQGHLSRFNIYSHALDAAGAQADMCRDKDPLDCVGLLARFVMKDGQWTDISHNGWKATHFGSSGLLAREGQPRMIGSGPTFLLDGTDDRAELTPRLFGGVHSFACWIKRDEHGVWSRVFQFGQSGRTDTDGIMINTESGTENMQVRLSIGGNVASVRVTNGMTLLHGGFAHVMYSIDSSSKLRIAINGVAMVTPTASNIPPVIQRAKYFIGASPWNNDLHNGELDDMRFYNYALSYEQMQELHCRGQHALDCVGLMGRWTFDHHTQDVSGSGWHSSLSENKQDDLHFSDSDVKQGSGSLQLKGDLESHLILPRRFFGGEVSVCTWVKYAKFEANSRLFSFGDGPGSNNVYIGNAGTTNQGQVRWVGQGSSVDVRVENLFTLNTWTHVCMTTSKPVVKSGKDTSTITVYKDGVSVATNEGDAIPLLKRINNYIGKSSSSANDVEFNGWLDDLRMYHRELTAAQVKELYDMY
eukprot:m.177504 g.177504  ORF g.177504 m.177504 type:complete len:1192 (-) comp16820_c0_seq1:215-3790(-)